MLLIIKKINLIINPIEPMMRNPNAHCLAIEKNSNEII